MDIRFYTVDENYLNYLKSNDSKVMVDKIGKRRRTYIGFLLTIERHFYLAPLSSTKKKHERMSNKIDFIKIGDRPCLGGVNLNNRIPVRKNLLKAIYFQDISDSCYRGLLENQYRLLNKKKEDIQDNTKKLYAIVQKETLNEYEQ